MSEVRIAAEPRTEFGKGGARRTRRAGKVPAVLYGHGESPRHISLPAREFFHALRTDAGANVLLRVDVDGSTELALPKAIQRDPVRGAIEHVDLLIVRRGERVVVEIPVATEGVVVPDGLVDHQLTALPVTAEATAIPQQFVVDINGMAIGAAVRAADIKLPAGVELHTDPTVVVVQVLAAPTAAEVEAELAGAEAELGAGAVAAEAAAAEAPAEGQPSAEGGAEAREPAEGRGVDAQAGSDSSGEAPASS